MKDKPVVKTSKSLKENEFEVIFPKKEPCKKESRLESFRNFLGNTINQCKRIKYNDVKMCAKLVRRKLGFNKAPKKKGYGKLITDEEKR